MSYQIPEPHKNPDKALVIFYKVRKNIQFDNTLWDKKNWGRCMVAAQEILEACGSFQKAKECIEELGGQYDKKDLEWKLETIARNSIEWMAKKERRHDQQNRQRFSDALAKQRSSYATPGKGESLTAGEMLSSIGNLEVIQSDDGTKERRRNTENGSSGERISPDGMEAKEVRGFEGAEGAVGL